MPLSPLTPASARYHVRRRGGTVLGPFEPVVLAAMLADGRLDGSEDISLDREIWRSIQTLVLPTVAPSLSSAGAAVGGTHPGVLDLGSDDDGILLPPLEIGLGDSSGGPGGHAPTSSAAPAGGGGGAGAGRRDQAPSGLGDLGELDLGESLELVERKPARSRAHAPGAAISVGLPAAPPATQPTGVQSPRVAERSASPGREAAVTGSTPLEPHDEVVQVAEEATRPVRLDEPAQAPTVDTRVRKRTLTASREGKSTAASGSRWRRPSQRSMIWAGAIGATAVAIAASIVLDLPDRMRGEPSQSATLGPTERELAQDHFQAFSEGARRLEEAAGTRRHVPVTRDAAAALLASSVVIHGGERGRIARAEALLEEGRTRPSTRPRMSHTRALAWVALAKGRWKEAEELVAEGPPELTQTDRAVLLGWAALGREDATRAATAFQVAVTADPAAFPSRVAARYALARAREAEVSTEAERAFRAVLEEAPSHFGAAMGLARVSRLSEPNRLKLVETVIAGQGRDASRVELAEAYALASRVAVGLGLGDKAATALKRAHDVDPTGVAAAVLEGDVLLAEGRTDEAIARYRLSLAAPVSAARTTWFRFARVAALVESARSGEAAKVLAELDRRLPGDARIAFWRGRAAERARPADATAAEQAYREALTRDPRFLPASLQLARLLLDQHRSPDGVAVLRKAEKEGAAAATLRLALGQALLASGNSDEAARTFRQAITADPKNPTAHLGLAAALESGGDLEGARVALAALGIRGDIPGLGARVAAVLLKLGRKDQALAAYRQEIDSGTATPATKVAAARVALELGQKEAARSLAQTAVDEDPRTPGALLTLADVRRADGDPGRALSELRRALVVDGSAQVQLEYGRALAALGRAEDALAALSLADEIPEAGVERGRILLRRGDLEAAARELSNATERLPSHAEAFLMLGQAEDRLGHVTRAESAWKTAVRLAPRSAESRYRLGRLQMDEGQAQAALVNLRAATDHLPTAMTSDQTSPIAPDWRPDFYFQLAFAELRKGTSDRALAAFKRYLQLAAPDAPARAEVLRQVQQLAAPAR